VVHCALKLLFAHSCANPCERIHKSVLECLLKQPDRMRPYPKDFQHSWKDKHAGNKEGMQPTTGFTHLIVCISLHLHCLLPNSTFWRARSPKGGRSAQLHSLGWSCLFSSHHIVNVCSGSAPHPLFAFRRSSFPNFMRRKLPATCNAH